MSNPDIAASAVEVEVSEHEELKAGRAHDMPVRRIREPTIAVKGGEAPGFQVNYEYIIWGLTIGLSILAIVERFTVNWWHANRLFWKNPFGLFEWSADVYIFISMVVGRLLVVSSGMVVLLQCRTLMNWFYEHKPRWLYIGGDIKSLNDKMHRQIAIWLVGVPVVIHVWTIFLPFIARCRFSFHPSWDLPKDTRILFEETRDKNKVHMHWTIHTLDEILSTTLAFCLFFPYSMIRKYQALNFTLCMWLHLIGAAWYLFELLAPKTNQHAWAFDAPIILLWICDRLYGIWFYRRLEAQIVRKVELGANYMIIYTRVNLSESKYEQLAHDRKDIEQKLADVYWLNSISTRLGERSHPFTSFGNHGQATEAMDRERMRHVSWAGHKFPVKARVVTRQPTQKLQVLDEQEEAEDLKGQEEDTEWNVGFIIQVHKPKKGSKRIPWTYKFFSRVDKYLGSLRAWGPYRSEYHELAEYISHDRASQPELVLAATGSGCAYILDFYHFLVRDGLPAAQNELRNVVRIFFSCRSLELFQFFTDTTCAHHIRNFRVHAHLTKHADFSIDEDSDKKGREMSRVTRMGRMNLDEIFKDCTDLTNTHVFFCGSPGIQARIRAICAGNAAIYHEGHVFG